jgi:hypothetical protein
MARRLRSPALLMAACVAVSICGGHRDLLQIASAVLLAVLVARGIRWARVLMIGYSLIGAFAVFYGSTNWGVSRPYAATYLALTCAVVQVGLLVSTPMYQRTRPGWAPGQTQAGPFLPWPKLWVALAGIVGGLALAVLPFSDGIRPALCSAAGSASAQACGAAGYGYPIAYRFYPSAYQFAGNNDLAPRGIDVAAFATDWALWGISILLVLYLVQLRDPFRGRLVVA